MAQTAQNVQIAVKIGSDVYPLDNETTSIEVTESCNTLNQNVIRDLISKNEVGVKEWQVDLEGIIITDADLQHARDDIDTNVTLWVVWGTGADNLMVAGDYGVVVTGYLTEFNTSAPRDGLVTISSSLGPHNGEMYLARVAIPWASYNAPSGTSPGNPWRVGGTTASSAIQAFQVAEDEKWRAWAYGTSSANSHHWYYTIIVGAHTLTERSINSTDAVLRKDAQLSNAVASGTQYVKYRMRQVAPGRGKAAVMMVREVEGT